MGLKRMILVVGNSVSQSSQIHNNNYKNILTVLGQKATII